MINEYKTGALNVNIKQLPSNKKKKQKDLSLFQEKDIDLILQRPERTFRWHPIDPVKNYVDFP